jgi:hypothetical protein
LGGFRRAVGEEPDPVQGAAGEEVSVLGVALILYVAAIVALAHALARE